MLQKNEKQNNNHILYILRKTKATTFCNESKIICLIAQFALKTLHKKKSSLALNDAEHIFVISANYTKEHQHFNNSIHEKKIVCYHKERNTLLYLNCDTFLFKP